MEFKGNQSQPNTNRQAPATEQRAAQPWAKPRRKLHMLAVAAVLIIVIGGLVMWWWKSAKADMAVMGDRYQALFLTNGQVYFGKLSNVSDKYVTLNDIYYLQVQESVNAQNRSFTTLSNVLKAQHDTVKTAIGNIR